MPPRVRGAMDFDSMIPRDASARLAGNLAAIDKENFLADENRSATKRGGDTYHTSETGEPSRREVAWTDCARVECGSQEK